MSLIVYVINGNTSATEIVYYLKVICFGNIRNQFLAGSLWFLTCLFTMEIIFWFIKKFRYNWLILVLSFVMYLLAMKYLGYLVNPSKPFNWDSAIGYMIYYAVGYVSFPFLQKWFNRKHTKGLVLSGIITGTYAAVRYLGKDPFGIIPLYSTANLCGTLVIIYFVLLCSFFFADVDFLGTLGRNTLYLCGGEYIARVIVDDVRYMFGITILIGNAFIGIIFSIALFLIAIYVLTPIEKYIVKKTQGAISSIKSRNGALKYGTN